MLREGALKVGEKRILVKDKYGNIVPTHPLRRKTIPYFDTGSDTISVYVMQFHEFLHENSSSYPIMLLTKWKCPC
jgi:hypothetical protein